jgi:poly(3-hydroxybutyrate) depolymerase
MSGAAGSAGSTGTAGSGGGSGLPNAVKSMGCGKAAGQELGMFVNHKETITASALVTEKWQPREYWVRLPANYDSNRAYPAVFVGPGCGGKGNNAQPIQNASGNDAIVVGIDYSASATGRDCFMTEAFPDPEVNYVEETAANVEAAFCVDKSRLFIEGFSSGSWIAYMEGCVDGGPGGLFKGIGTATGNWQGSLPDTACKGPVAFFGSHDSGDPQGYNMYPGGRDHVLKLNGCTMPAVTTPYDAGPMVKAPTGNSTVTCVQYMGCQAPTVFCTTTGLGHNDQVASGISTYGFWKFWMSLP